MIVFGDCMNQFETYVDEQMSRYRSLSNIGHLPASNTKEDLLSPTTTSLHEFIRRNGGS